MKRCCVPGCKNTSNLRMVPFTDGPRWEAWLVKCPFLRKYSLKSLDNVRICEVHFLAQHVINHRLTSDAIPLLNLQKKLNVRVINQPQSMLEPTVTEVSPISNSMASAAHNMITRRNKPKQVTKPINTTKNEVKQKPVKIEASPPKITQKVKYPEPISKPVESEDKTLPKIRNAEFKCPKCLSVFATYFPAHKHIQKYHCVNKAGEKVAPNSPNLIQPIRIELCYKCNKEVTSMLTHICDKTENQVLICTACDELLPNIKAFDMHVLSAHGDNIESMFFPTITEFTKWKTNMEAQTGVNYIVLEKYDTKRYYHCNFIKENDGKGDTPYICPSTIVVQEFPKGIQVNFCKQHYKHNCTDYALTDKYKKYSITSFLKCSEEYNNLPTISSDDSDLYLQFKSLMEGIIVGAAKINIATLKILLGKALDMTSYLTNYDEEVEEIDNIIKVKHMTEAQITKALEPNLPVSKRRNSENSDNSAQIKIMKQDTGNDMSRKIKSSFSLANNYEPPKNHKSDTDSKKSDDDIEKSKQNNKKSNEWDPYSSSFNDSCKDIMIKKNSVAEADIKNKARKRPALLTKMRHFKPNILSKSPKTQEAAKVKEKTPVRTSFDKPNIDIKYEVKEQEEGCNILILIV